MTDRADDVSWTAMVVGMLRAIGPLSPIWKVINQSVGMQSSVLLMEVQ